MKNAREKVAEIMAIADIQVGGNRPQDITVTDERAFQAWLSDVALGLGESYMKGWWTSNQLDETVRHLFLKRDVINKKIGFDFNLILLAIKSRLSNRQTISRAKIVGESHYDISNDLYEAMLDDYMQYSCAYWDRGANDLHSAQRDKLQLIADKLKLSPGMRVLDIGCGWGGLANYLNDKCGVQVVGLTISEEQRNYAQSKFGSRDIEFRLQDYRLCDDGPYDRIVSVGMLEHVGYKNYSAYFNKISDLLSDDGLALVHSIGCNVTDTAADPWIDKYIFPNGMLPSLKQIGNSIPEPMVIEDWHNFGASYDRTLVAWHRRFIEAWPDLSEKLGLDEQFRRMWEFYLLACAGNFRSRKRAQLWQIVLAKIGQPGGYQSVR